MTSTRAGGIGRIIARMVVTMMTTMTRSRRVFAQCVKLRKIAVMARRPCRAQASQSWRMVCLSTACRSQPHGKRVGASPQHDATLLDPLDHPSIAGQGALEQLLAAPIDDIGPRAGPDRLDGQWRAGPDGLGCPLARRRDRDPES